MKQTVHQNVRLQVQADGDLETKQLNGRDHLVVPVIMLVEGVLFSSNASAPALALAEEFGIFPEGWDGRPVMYGHPKINDEAVSANLPEMWDAAVIGQLFNSAMKGRRKLRSYMWIDKEKAPAEVLNTLEEGGVFEVSTGLYALEDPVPGTYNGKKYSSIWRNIVPDHLAILPKGSVGACSIDDGCGAPRSNEGKESTMTTPNPAAAPVQAPAPAVPTPSAGVTNSTTPTAATTAAPAPAPAAAVHANCGGGDIKVMEKKFLDKLRSNAQKMFKGFMQSMGLQASELSDNDVRTAVQMALDEEVGGPDDDGGVVIAVFVIAVFPSKVVYQCLDDGWEWTMWQESYSVTEGGAVSLGGDEVEVRPETQYVPLVIADPNSGEPAANATNPKGTSMTQTPAPNAPAAATPAAAAPVVEQPRPAEAVKANSLDELKKMASPEVAAQLDIIIKANVARGNILVAALKDKVGLDEAELKALPLESLEKMAAKLASTPAPATPAAPAAPGDFRANAPAPTVPNTNEEEDKGYTPAPNVFEIGTPAQRTVKQK
jgi:hypothetical protein